MPRCFSVCKLHVCVRHDKRVDSGEKIELILGFQKIGAAGFEISFGQLSAKENGVSVRSGDAKTVNGKKCLKSLKSVNRKKGEGKQFLQRLVCRMNFLNRKFCHRKCVTGNFRMFFVER